MNARSPRPPYPRTHTALVNQPVPADASPAFRDDVGDWTMLPMTNVASMAANESALHAQHEFANDGESRFNLPMLFCVVVFGVATCGLLFGAYKLLAGPVASLFMQAIAHPYAFGVGVGVVTLLVLGAVFGFRARGVQA